MYGMSPSPGESLASRAAEHHRLRSPREDGGTLIEPPLARVPQLLAANAERRSRYDYDVQGRSLLDLSQQARRDLCVAARNYTSAYRDLPAPATTDTILLAGHQPQIFHPGVWFKNFALAKLARQHRATAINLLIDSDTLKEAALRVPAGSVDAPIAEKVAFDQPTAEIPYEERKIVDFEQWSSFGDRASETIRPLVPNPLLTDYWPRVVARSRQTSNLGECLAQGRHQLEGDWGVATLEVPQSRICCLEAFHWFTAHLLAQLPRFWGIYNGAVAEYRAVNHIRSANHPVPNLAAEADWLEAPFWIWSAAAPRRRRLFVRFVGSETILTDREGLEIRLPLTADGDGAGAVSVLAELASRGIRLRTRALLTTLFARLFLGDLFLHGIGGGKYDQLTDLLVRRFFDLEPPEFMILSATLHLPIDRPQVTADEARHVDQQLRELAYHPERFLSEQFPNRTRNGPPGDAASDASPVALAATLAATKREWVETEPNRDNARTRCHAIRRANEELQPWLETRRQQLLAEREQIDRLLRAESVLAWREYGFCLYPEMTLRNFLLEFMADRP
jgi:hypothetical protein